MTTSLVSAAHAAATRIEVAAAWVGTSYAAEQGWYGVEFEALVDDGWVRGCDLDPQQESDAVAVRFFDCDRHRSATCHTAEELAAEENKWVAALATTDAE